MGEHGQGSWCARTEDASGERTDPSPDDQDAQGRQGDTTNVIYYSLTECTFQMPKVDEETQTDVSLL